MCFQPNFQICTLLQYITQNIYITQQAHYTLLCVHNHMHIYIYTYIHYSVTCNVILKHNIAWCILYICIWHRYYVIVYSIRLYCQKEKIAQYNMGSANTYRIQEKASEQRFRSKYEIGFRGSTYKCVYVNCIVLVCGVQQRAALHNIRKS